MLKKDANSQTVNSINDMIVKKVATMFKLTDRRFAVAEPILERYLGQFLTAGEFDVQGLERELYETWNVTYRELKDVAIQLVEIPRFRRFAAYYMENSNGIRGLVATEFKEVLAKLYGTKWYDAPDREQRRQEFWEAASIGSASGDAN